MSSVETSVISLVVYQLIILVAGTSLTYMGYRLLLVGDPKLITPAGVLAGVGIIGLVLGCWITRPALPFQAATPPSAVSSVPDSIMQSLCRATFPKNDRERFLKWYAAAGKECP